MYDKSKYTTPFLKWQKINPFNFKGLIQLYQSSHNNLVIWGAIKFNASASFFFVKIGKH